MYFSLFLKLWRHKWHLFLATTLKIWKAMFKTLQTFLLEKNNSYSENPMSKGLNGVKLQVIKEIQISRRMTIYGQTLGVFKRENHECICNGEKTKLHKIVVFWILHMWWYDAYFVTNYVIMTSKWRNSWRNTRYRPHILTSKNCNFVFMQICLFSVATTIIVFAFRVFPGRPRGSQSGRVKKRDESFQVRAKEPLGTDSRRTISKIQADAGSWLGKKKCFVLLCPIGEHISWVLFVCSYTTATVLIAAWLAHAPKKCTQSGNVQFEIQSPSSFKILSARKLKTLFQKYKLQLTTGTHTCISHVLRKYLYLRVFKRYHDGWQPRKRHIEKWIHIFSVSIVIILCQMQANSSGAEFLPTIYIQVYEETWILSLLVYVLPKIAYLTS